MSPSVAVDLKHPVDELILRPIAIWTGLTQTNVLFGFIRHGDTFSIYNLRSRPIVLVSRVEFKASVLEHQVQFSSYPVTLSNGRGSVQTTAATAFLQVRLADNLPWIAFLMNDGRLGLHEPDGPSQALGRVLSIKNPNLPVQ